MGYVKEFTKSISGIKKRYYEYKVNSKQTCDNMFYRSIGFLERSLLSYSDFIDKKDLADLITSLHYSLPEGFPDNRSICTDKFELTKQYLVECAKQEIVPDYYHIKDNIGLP